MAAYLKDVENNTRDITADRIIQEKKNRIETKDVGTRLYLSNISLVSNCRVDHREISVKNVKTCWFQTPNPNRVPMAAPETMPRFRGNNQQVRI